MNVDYAAIASTLKRGLRDAVSVAAAAAGSAATFARDTLEDLTAVKGLRGYRVLPGPVATAGPLDCWRIYEAVAVSAAMGAAGGTQGGGGGGGGGAAGSSAGATAAAAAPAAPPKPAAAAYPVVGVWILDKRALAESLALRGGAGGGGGGGGFSSSSSSGGLRGVAGAVAGAAGMVALSPQQQQALEPALALLRRGAAQMARVRHPGVLRVLEPLEETGGQMVLVTEPVYGSLSNLLTGFRAVPELPGGGGDADTAAAANNGPPSSSTSPQQQQQQQQQQRPRSRREQPPPSELELKYALVHLAETLEFLNRDARLAHGGVSPRSVVVTRDGGWRLAGFEFCAPLGGGGSGSGASQQQQPRQQEQPHQQVSYDYYSSAPPVESMLAPPLSFTAPELVSGGGPPAGVGMAAAPWLVPPDAAGVLTAGADAFSLAALAYELSTGGRRRLLPAPEVTGGGRGGGGGVDAVASYRARLAALQAGAAAGLPLGSTTAAAAAANGGGVFGAVAAAAAASSTPTTTPPDAPPPSLEPALRAMLLSPSPSARPSCASLALAPYFQDDMLLRALRFLDGALQREPGQKVAFLQDLSSLWPRFDDRLLRHRVLPPIVAEMRSSEVVALAALPLVLAVMERRLTARDFEEAALLPALRPVFEKADGEVQLALVRALPVFQRLLPPEACDHLLVPLILRACDNPTPKSQEEVLRGLLKALADVRPQTLRAALVPKVAGMCLRTTSLAVRVAALRVLSSSVPRLADRAAAGGMVQMLAQVVAVDRSGGTAMAALELCESVSRAHGAEATAQQCLPLLCPMLAGAGAAGLTAAQFGALREGVRGMVDRAAGKREAELGGAAAVASALAAVQQQQQQQQQQNAEGGGGVSAGATGGSARSVGAVAGPTAAAAAAPVSWQQAALVGGGGGGAGGAGAGAAAGAGGGGGGGGGGAFDPFALSPPPASAPRASNGVGVAAAAPLDDLLFSGGYGAGLSGGQAAAAAAPLSFGGAAPAVAAAAVDDDPFGSLAAARAPAPAPFLAPPLPPPPRPAAAGSKVIGPGGLTGDPFAVLAGGAGAAAAAAAPSVAADDPFGQLAASRAPTSAGGAAPGYSLI